MGTAGMVWSITSDNSWIAVGPDPEGSVSATYTGRPRCTRWTAWLVRVLRGHLKPLHPIDDLDGRTHHELGRAVESTAQNHRCAVWPRSPGRGTRSGRLRDGRAPILAESLRQRRQQCFAAGTGGLRSGHGRNDNRSLRRLAVRRDNQDYPDHRRRQRRRGDQHGARRPVGLACHLRGHLFALIHWRGPLAPAVTQLTAGRARCSKVHRARTGRRRRRGRRRIGGCQLLRVEWSVVVSGVR